jgi:hypothetical protein
LEHGKDVELRCSLVALVRASQIMTDGTKDVVEYGRKQGRRTDAKFFASPRSFLTFSFFEFAISVVPYIPNSHPAQEFLLDHVAK